MANFPDLNDDGKITRADVLKGRGVFKKGGKVKKKRYEDGGEIEFQSKMGANPQIDEIHAHKEKEDKGKEKTIAAIYTLEYGEESVGGTE